MKYNQELPIVRPGGPGSQTESLIRSMNWRDTDGHYAGRWVAIQNGKPIASGVKLSDIEEAMNLPETLIRRCDSADDPDILRGAISAQDAREKAAGLRCGVPYEEHGCDWPDAVADRVLELQRELEELQRAKGNLT